MKIAYLIIAHHNPNHLRRLVSQLISDPRNHCFVHIDKKSKVKFDLPESDQITMLRDRKKVYWCDYSNVVVTLDLMRAALKHHLGMDFFVLMSGSCFPIRSQTYVHDYLSEHRDDVFLMSDTLPSSVFNKRIGLIKWRAPKPYKKDSLHHKAYLRLQKHKVVETMRDYTTVFGDMKPYSGSQWWAWGREASEYVVEFADSNPAFMKYFERTVCPEESFFPTILENSSFAEKIRSTVTFVDWSDGPPHPVDMAHKHLEMIAVEPFVSDYNPAQPTSHYLFARKFLEESGDLIAEIEATF